MQCNAMQYNTIQCNAMQYNTIQYNTMQCNTIQYNTIQYNTIQYNTIQRDDGARSRTQLGAHPTKQRLVQERRSKRVLKLFRDGAVTTVSGREFQVFGTLSVNTEFSCSAPSLM